MRMTKLFAKVKCVFAAYEIGKKMKLLTNTTVIKTLEKCLSLMLFFIGFNF